MLFAYPALDCTPRSRTSHPVCASVALRRTCQAIVNGDARQPFHRWRPLQFTSFCIQLYLQTRSKLPNTHDQPPFKPQARTHSVRHSKIIKRATLIVINDSSIDDCSVVMMLMMMSKREMKESRAQAVCVLFVIMLQCDPANDDDVKRNPLKRMINRLPTSNRVP